ncbi:MAG: hypothetical protein HRF43_15440 [Phycisphaerae bacterium]|jgi:regulator of protease activity HflC (stomatin/prohibitin superfamily)
MMIEKPERRARNIALVGLVFQALLCILFLFLWRASESEALRGLTFLSGVGCWIWLALLMVYHQRALVQDEAFETEQLRRETAGLAGERIFDTEGERLLLARRRLSWMYRWLLPAFTVVLLLFFISMTIWSWPWSFADRFQSARWPAVKPLENGLLIWFVGGAAFLSFLLSRYAVGMARHAEWQMLRAGASYLMGITLAAGATAVVLAVMHFSNNTIVTPERVVAYVIRILMGVLAVEFLLNGVLDFYRPRAPGEEPRPAFDSRLLGLFSEPGGIAGSIAEAINYQFGFDVSSTWFYQLLGRSVVPLIAFGVLTLFAASSLVFVSTGEEAIIEHFGRPHRIGDRVASLGPGLHVKWPWPIDVAHKVGTAQIHELKIGVKETSAAGEEPKPGELILWTNKHSQEPHLMVLLAAPEIAQIMRREATRPAPEADRTSPDEIPLETRRAEEARALPVSILRVAATLQYKVRDAWQWLTEYEDPRAMLEAIANREVMRHCASADVMGLLGSDRGRIEKQIWESVQQSANQVRLGIDVVFFGLQGVHPPEDVAPEFEKVVSAQNEKVATINTARSEYNKKLTEAGGLVAQARDLDAAIREMNRLDSDPAATPEQRRRARERVDLLFFGRADQDLKPIGGRVAVRIAEARAKRWQLENDAKSQAIAFESAIATKNVAPRVFQMRRYLDTLTSSTEKARKYVIAAEGRFELPVFLLDLKDAMSAPLQSALEEKK